MRTILAAIALLVVTAAPAAAEPPSPNTPCTPDLTGATTMQAGQLLPLVCTGGRWAAVTVPGDPSDRWVSFGPEMALHGEGLRNPNLASGTWTATPLEPQTSCGATQQSVVSAGVVGAPMTTTAPIGQPLTVVVMPRLFDIVMTGHCLWTRNR
ncbi:MULTISPECIES: hypothetical protein [Mycobacteriaceae]|uniref:Secreted protein n=1 Tax=Mycolicibacterium neoaurum VKM Ac-1815D TaxID=700508 RepID=V5XHT9_MYCNE|nr:MULTISPECIES: hypothetical protein [Mycobacteriaceae]AHC27413.1 hypothetical protein D174_23940 [Mycolicibacterium neoaurum VKM Ac-1815D]AMO07629.1 hypothetical protein MyAD_23485 [Mycolicibacterium neoaurum]AXK73984.1 hypothetical protein DXK33_01375 [Mycolicibacterium neoaurum]KJQ51582.1 hypothetical protein TS71_02070 [Mycolicibacterium neoaurum]KUM08841.1 hypothetical protein AVZ31_08740 [Mycolicibacterium neoaurum]